MNYSTKENSKKIDMSDYIINTYSIILFFLSTFLYSYFKNKDLKRIFKEENYIVKKKSSEFSFSKDKKHRYYYKQKLDNNKEKKLVIVGCQPNPNDDNGKPSLSIRKVENLINKYYSLIYGTFIIINIFSNMYIEKEDFMNTDSDELCSKENIVIFRKLLDDPSVDCDVVYAWGNRENWNWDKVNPEIRKILENCKNNKKILCFGKNKNGEPQSIGFSWSPNKSLEEYR